MLLIWKKNTFPQQVHHLPQLQQTTVLGNKSASLLQRGQVARNRLKGEATGLFTPTNAEQERCKSRSTVTKQQSQIMQITNTACPLQWISLDRYATNVKGICGSLCATGWTHICPSCRPSRCISRSQVGHKQEQNLHGHRASWIHMTTASSTLANPLSLNFPISNVCPESVPPPTFRDCEKFRKKIGSRNNPHVEEQSLVCSWHKNIGEMKRKSEI